MRAASVARRPTVLPSASMINHLRSCSRFFPLGMNVLMVRISKLSVKKTNRKNTKWPIYCQVARKTQICRASTDHVSAQDVDPVDQAAERWLADETYKNKEPVMPCALPAFPALRFTTDGSR